MITFSNEYIEKQVRETLFDMRKPSSETQELTQEHLSRIDCISISSSRIRDIRGTKLHNTWIENDGKYWRSFTWTSLNLDYRELIKTNGWEEDLKQFSRIHTLQIEEQVSIDFIRCFKHLGNLRLSKIDIPDWSFILDFIDLYSIVLDECGCNGNQAVKNICNLYAKQKEPEIRKERNSGGEIDFIAVIGMNVNDLTPFMNLTEPMETWELNLSANEINDILPLSGIKVHVLILDDNNIESIEHLNLPDTQVLYINNNRIKPEDIIRKEKEKMDFYINA